MNDAPGNPHVVRVFVNGRGLDVPSGASVRQTLEAWDSDIARAVQAGERVVTDSRGLPTELSALVHGGAILRIVAARGGGGGAPASDEIVDPAP